jgi:hypothetical protein
MAYDIWQPMHRRESRLSRVGDWFKRNLVGVLVGVVISLLMTGGLVRAANTPPNTNGQQVFCPSGADLVVHGDGTWSCGPTPTPSPSASASPTPSTSPSVSPSASPSASPSTSPPAPTPSASPTPSPSGPPSTRLAKCLPRLAECGYPHPGNTGVPAGVTLTAYTGPSTITTPNTVIDGKTMGCIKVRAAGVVIQNSRITGPCSYAVDVDSGGTVTVRNSVVDCVNHKGTGFVWRNYTVRSTQILNCENGFHTSGNVDVQDSYISGVVEVDDGHGDGVQGSSGSNYRFAHNTFDLRNPITSSIIWDDQTMHNVLIEDNFFMAGAYTIYCPSAGSNVVYRNNRFYGPVGNWPSDPARPAFGFWTNCGSWIVRTGNYRDDTLGAI